MAVLAHCTSDITPPPCLPEQTFSRKGKHADIILMGENEEGKSSFCGCGGRADLMVDLLG